MSEWDTPQLSALVRRLQSGDKAAFNDLYTATNQPAYFTALKIVHNEDDAQDILQESYIKLLEKIGELQDPDTFVAWFNRIVANKAKDHVKKKNPSLFRDAETEAHFTQEIPDDDRSYTPETGIEQNELRREMMQIIDGLNDEKRTCVILYYYDEMSVKDIAASLEISESAVKSRLFHARKEIKTEVEALAKKNKKLLGVPAIPLAIWALKSAGMTAGAAFAGSAAAAGILAAITGTLLGHTAAAGGAAVAGGVLAKLAAFTVGQKIVAGVVAAGVVAGAAAGATTVRRHNLERAANPSGEAVTTAFAGDRPSDAALEAWNAEQQPQQAGNGNAAQTPGEAQAPGANNASMPNGAGSADAAAQPGAGTQPAAATASAAPGGATQAGAATQAATTGSAGAVTKPGEAATKAAATKAAATAKPGATTKAAAATAKPAATTKGAQTTKAASTTKAAATTAKPAATTRAAATKPAATAKPTTTKKVTTTKPTTTTTTKQAPTTTTTTVPTTKGTAEIQIRVKKGNEYQTTVNDSTLEGSPYDKKQVKEILVKNGFDVSRLSYETELPIYPVAGETYVITVDIPNNA